MPLTITKLSASCDVQGCDKQAEAPIQRLKSLGWSIRFLQNGSPVIASICSHATTQPEIYQTICPRCSMAKHYIKMELPQ